MENLQGSQRLRCHFRVDRSLLLRLSTLSPMWFVRFDRAQPRGSLTYFPVRSIIGYLFYSSDPSLVFLRTDLDFEFKRSSTSYRLSKRSRFGTIAPARREYTKFGCVSPEGRRLMVTSSPITHSLDLIFAPFCTMHEAPDWGISDLLA